MLVSRKNEYGQPVGDPVEWSGAQPPARRAIVGVQVELQPMTPEHAAGLYDAVGTDPELWTYQSEEPPEDAETLAGWIAATRDDMVEFAIVDRATGDVRGRASYLRIQPQVGSIEVGAIIYGRALQRTRAATEVQYLLMRYAFELGYRRYEWKCDSLNRPSRSAALRLGFTEEGTWRNARVMKGRNRDTTWFAITDDDWPRVRDALEAWLADDNFDENGAQRRSLTAIRSEASGSRR